MVEYRGMRNWACGCCCCWLNIVVCVIGAVVVVVVAMVTQFHFCVETFLSMV